ncbi:hypothetical protein CHL78_003210 [Romboutsia weinsteinii]|uniref:NEAT domain-containing protein n=1 Tax=Romboutsia weinsteinii TaxID=2020949 RepID=A0A371J870_9FIRM|nr:NEAT domain-containing protein [Romboutsia weinsteinii]RDY28944.1 hypothetical protein CHL78_003210 [Romboutsia weinsteinii]
MKKLYTNIAKLFSLAIVSVMILSSGFTYADEIKTIESGIYQLNNDVNYDGAEIGMTMARSYTNEVMNLEYTKEKKSYTIEFLGTDYMENYRIAVNDKEVEVEVVEANEEANAIKLKFDINDVNDKIVAKIYVDAMGRDVEFEIIPKVDTLNLIEKIEELEEKVEEAKETTTKEDETTEEKSGGSPVVIAVGVVMIVGAIVVMKRKKK